MAIAVFLLLLASTAFGVYAYVTARNDANEQFERLYSPLVR